MEKRRWLLQLFSLLVLLILAFLFIFLQNFQYRLLHQKEQGRVETEQKDIYNEYGLPNGTGLSWRTITEDDAAVYYTDRIVSTEKIDSERVPYVLDAGAALLRAAGDETELFLLPIPTRLTASEGSAAEQDSTDGLSRGMQQRSRIQEQSSAAQEEYEALIGRLETLASDWITIVNPLSELLEHAGEYTYFRTEDSWTMRGAFYGMQSLRSALGKEPEKLSHYRTYVFGSFEGELLRLAEQSYDGTEYEEKIRAIPNDPFYIYLKGDVPNREILIRRNSEEEQTRVKRHLVLMNDGGIGSIVGTGYEYSVAFGNGEGSVLLVCDSRGKLLAPYLTELYETVYVVNVRRYRELGTLLQEIAASGGVREIVWAQSATEMGNSTYMRALNVLMTEEGGDAVE